MNRSEWNLMTDLEAKHIPKEGVFVWVWHPMWIEARLRLFIEHDFEFWIMESPYDYLTIDYSAYEDVDLDVHGEMEAGIWDELLYAFFVPPSAPALIEPELNKTTIWKN